MGLGLGVVVYKAAILALALEDGLGHAVKEGCISAGSDLYEVVRDAGAKERGAKVACFPSC